MKKWLVKILRKMLKKLEPTIFEEVSITHSYKPLVTITANLSLDKRDIEWISEENVKGILARQLSEQIIDRMDMRVARSYEPIHFDEQIHYIATIQIADSKNKDSSFGGII